MKRERGVFRSLALGAKERLSGNFWFDVRGAKLAEIKKAHQGGRSGSEVLTQFMTQVKSKVIRAQESDTAFEQLYTKVREFLCSTVDGNPLAAVLDRDHMRQLGDSERERYVFNLSEKVKACVERFEQEKSFALLNCQ